MQIFDSYIEAGQHLKPRDREQYYRALIEFIYDGREPSAVSANVMAVLTAIMPSLRISKTKAEAGKQGGSASSKTASKHESKTEAEAEANNEAKAKQNYKQTVSKPGSKTSENEQANSNSNSRSKEILPNGSKKKGAFAPPTREEVAGFIAESGCSTVDPDRFIDFYASNGWKVGKNPMKDWQAAVRSWHRRNLDEKPKEVPHGILGEYADALGF